MKETQTGIICGIDEAGRGALAGPLVAAAVILPKTIKTVSRRVGFRTRDGKLLTEKQRRRVYAALKRMRAMIAVEVISALQINHRGIAWANREIMRKLIKRMSADIYIADGNLKIGRIAGKSTAIRSVVDADATVGEVICAGIVAKVERDRIMQQLDREFPHFLWKENAGYGTLAHIAALRSHKLSRYHRNIYVTTALAHNQV